MEDYKEHTQCRICKSDNMTEYLDLGHLPLSNKLCNSMIEFPKRYPLKVMLCNNCGLSQLSIVVDPHLMFDHYVYRSSISKTYRDHCKQMAYDLAIQYKFEVGMLHIDIAGNDGTLLSAFQSIMDKNRMLNIDPAENLAEISKANKIPTITKFWSKELALEIVDKYGKADLVTATNVFAHVDEVYDFMRGIELVLSNKGVCILEFPYLIDFIEKNEFDTIYFEHLSYFSIRPLLLLCNEVNLFVNKVEHFDIHGGSLRVHIGHKSDLDSSVLSYINKEAEYRYLAPYKEFARISKNTITDFWNKISKLFSKYKIAGFAASAKGNTLLNCAGIGFPMLQYIVDETPEKIEYFSPGTHLVIKPLSYLIENPPDYLVILSWNFSDEIIEKCKRIGYKGKFVIPIPTPIILD